MKKLLSLSRSKICLLTGVFIIVTLISFGHQRLNQSHLDRMNSMSQGVSTCFNRISQTFTALMIKDIRSPYLNRSFMSLSDECLNETVKGINPFRKDVGKGYQILNQLVSEVNWFHETVIKIHAPLVANQKVQPSMIPLIDRFSKMENFKTDLIDEIEDASVTLKRLQKNDEYLIALSLIFFVLALGLLSIQEYHETQIKKKIEGNSASLLNSRSNSPDAIIHQIIDNALQSQKLIITAKVFRDYHGELLERLVTKQKIVKDHNFRSREAEILVTDSEEKWNPDVNAPDFKSSFKEALLSIKKTQPNDLMQIQDVRDVILNISNEMLEQILSSAINQLSTRRVGSKKISISNQIHSEKTVISIFLAGSIFSVTDLDFAQSKEISNQENLDINLVILKEMINESGIQWHLENRLDRSGNLTGANIKLIIKRTLKEKAKLLSITKGKKKDIAKALAN
jgi:hypothetical protein